MAVNNMLILLVCGLVIPVCCSAAWPDSRSGNFRSSANEGCIFKGYKPALNGVTVAEIESHKSTMSKMSGGGGLLDLLFGDFGYPNAEATRGAIREIFDFASTMSATMAKSAPYIGPIIGFFGAVAGGVNTATGEDTTSKQILDGVDKSIFMLTGDVNSRIKKLGNYVNQEVRTKVLTLVKDMLSSKLMQWKECALRIGRDEQEDCSEECGWNLHGTIGLYRKFRKEFESKETIKGKDVMTLEAYLITTRDYMEIFLMVAKSIIEANIKSTDPVAKQKCKRFAQLLKERSQYFTEYFDWAVTQIIAWHKGKEYDNDDTFKNVDGHPGQWSTERAGIYPGQCADTLKCDQVANGGGKDWKGGQKRQAKCRCQIVGGNEMCETTITYQTDEAIESPTYQYVYINAEAVTKFGKEKGLEELRFWKAGLMTLTSRANEYMDTALPVIEKYWEQEVTALLAPLGKAKQYAEKVLDKLQAVDLTRFQDRKHKKVE